MVPKIPLDIINVERSLPRVPGKWPLDPWEFPGDKSVFLIQTLSASKVTPGVSLGSVCQQGDSRSDISLTLGRGEESGDQIQLSGQ